MHLVGLVLFLTPSINMKVLTSRLIKVYFLVI